MIITQTTQQQEIKITVLQEDIEWGVPRSACACPVARALGRALGFGKVTVGILNWEHTNFNVFRSGRIPDEVRNFILQFDAGVSVEPFTFLAAFTMTVWD